jgi:serine/alanine adding enzyme
LTVRIGPFTGTADEWNGFAAQRHGSTHCHRHEWSDVIGEAFGHECVYLAARGTDGRLAGVLPLVHVRSVVFGNYLVSMPFLNYGGPLATDGAHAALVDAAVDAAGDRRAGLLELRSVVQLPVDLPVSHRKITVHLDIPGDGPEALFSSFKGKLRSQVRRPLKAGATVKWGPSEVGAFYDVFARHMRDLGTPVLGRRLFDAASRAFGDDMWVAVVYLDGQPAAGGVGFRWGSEIEMTWASSRRSASKASPNMLLYWAMMERAAEEKVRTFNFGRCSPGSSTHTFKLQWGARDVPLWWYQFSPHEDVPRGTPAPTDGRFSWGPRVWRRLPLFVANRLGPRIVKYIP